MMIAISINKQNIIMIHVITNLDNYTPLSSSRFLLVITNKLQGGDNVFRDVITNLRLLAFERSELARNCFM